MTNAVRATPYSGIGSRSSCGMMNPIQKITITSGTPRKNSTYIVAGTRIHLALASRASPTAIPSANPSTIAGTANRSVPPMNGPIPINPCKIKNRKLFATTEKSIAYRRPDTVARPIKSRQRALPYRFERGLCPRRLWSRLRRGSPRPPPTERRRWPLFIGQLRRRAHARDETRDRVMPFDPRHDRGDRHAQHQIDERAGGQRLDRLGGVRLDLARLEGQLGHADGQGDRRVLEQVERLVRAGRNDEAERDGQDHQPVGLERRQPDRHRGLELRAGYRADPGPDHLRHARPVVDAKRDGGGPELGAVVEDPVLGRPREQRRHGEVPEEHPHQQGDVAEELDVERGRPAQRPERYGPQRAGEDAESDRQDPGQRRELERGDEALQEPVTRLAAPEHRPLERVAHRGSVRGASAPFTQSFPDLLQEIRLHLGRQRVRHLALGT